MSFNGLALPGDLVLGIINGDGDRRPGIIASQTITIVLAFIAVLLRFCSRWVSKTSLWWDDWLMIPPLVLAIAVYSTFFVSMNDGLGRFIGTATLNKLNPILRIFFIGEICYALLLAFVKFSILALYWRIFRSKVVRYYVYVMGFIIGSSAIAEIVSFCMQCRPTYGFYDRTVGPTCNVNVTSLILATAIINLLTDIILLVFPIVLCARLKLNTMNKVLVCGVFATGCITTITAGVWIWAVVGYHLDDITFLLNLSWTGVDIILWSGVQCNLTIVSACLPCLRPLVALIVPKSMVPTPLRKHKQSHDKSTTTEGSSTQASHPAIVMASKPGTWTQPSGHHEKQLEDSEADSPQPSSTDTRRETTSTAPETPDGLLPIHNMEGYNIRTTMARMDRPPSFNLGVPLYYSETHTQVSAGRPRSQIPEGITVERSVDIESGRGSPTNVRRYQAS